MSMVYFERYSILHTGFLIRDSQPGKESEISRRRLGMAKAQLAVGQSAPALVTKVMQPFKSDSISGEIQVHNRAPGFQTSQASMLQWMLQSM
jgi:hypothetical protein